MKTSWNAEFNKNNARIGTVAGPGASAESPQWVHVECPYTNLADLTKAQPDLFSAPLKTGITMWAAQESGLWVTNETSQALTLKRGTELFSFGAGDFLDGNEAADVMGHDGSWICCSLTMASLVTLDLKTVPEHITQDLAGIKPLGDVVRILQDTGEKILISHHEFQQDGQVLKPTKKLCFQLDPPKKPSSAKKQKKAASQNCLHNPNHTHCLGQPAEKDAAYLRHARQR